MTKQLTAPELCTVATTVKNPRALSGKISRIVERQVATLEICGSTPIRACVLDA